MITVEQVGSFRDDFVYMAQNRPDYLLWWYSAKSVGLGLVGAFAAFMVGREVGRRGAGGDTPPEFTLTLDEPKPRRRRRTKRRRRA